MRGLTTLSIVSLTVVMHRIYRYNLSTALYMLEPWERALFNCIVLSMLAYIAYGLYYSALHPLFEKFAESYK